MLNEQEDLRQRFDNIDMFIRVLPRVCLHADPIMKPRHCHSFSLYAKAFQRPRVLGQCRFL